MSTKLMYAHSETTSFGCEMGRVPTEKARQPKSSYVLIRAYLAENLFMHNLLMHNYIVICSYM